MRDIVHRLGQQGNGAPPAGGGPQPPGGGQTPPAGDTQFGLVPGLIGGLPIGVYPTCPAGFVPYWSPWSPGLRQCVPAGAYTIPYTYTPVVTFF